MTQQQMQRAADAISGIYQDLEELLMANIIRHIEGYEQPIASDTWLLQRLAEIGRLNQENIKTIASHAGLSRAAAERMLEDMAEDAMDSMEPAMRHALREGYLEKAAVSVGKSKNVKQVMKALRSQAKDTLNLCNTTMLYKARDAYVKLAHRAAAALKDVTDKQEYLDVMNKHGAAVVTGVEARQQAVRSCIKEFADKGIPAFVDKKGREWTPEAYVNMAMRNTAKQVAVETQNARCKDYGVRLIEIDSHSGARPKCAKDQGKIFSLDNDSGETEDLYGKKVKYYPWNSSSYGEPDGILGINCRHRQWPFVPGISLQRYFPTEDMAANDKLYKETQMQRALERDVRKQKRECMLLDEAGDEEGFEEAAVKLKQKEARLREYVNGNDQLHRRKDREQVVGFDKRISASAVAADRKHKATAKNVSAEVTDLGTEKGISNKPVVAKDKKLHSGDNSAKADNKQKYRKSRERKEILKQEDIIAEAKSYGDELLKDNSWLTYDNGYPISNYLNKKLGYDALPRVVSAEEFDALRGNKDVLYRGVTSTADASAKEMVDEFKHGKFYAGRGIYGYGTYTDTDKRVAEYYASYGKGEIMEMILADDARTVDYKKIFTEYEKTGIPRIIGNKPEAYQDVLDNVGSYAAIKGYDAILLNGFQNKQHVVILNRGKVIVKE